MISKQNHFRNTLNIIGLEDALQCIRQKSRYLFRNKLDLYFSVNSGDI